MRSPGGLETTVAIKLLRLDLALEDDAVRRLRDEGRALARLDHPAILRVHDLVVLDGRVGLVTELVDGCDLVTASRIEPPPGVRALLQVGSQVAGALDEAWNASGPSGPLRMVHRDVKPSNILIGRHGQVKLVDFGIARSDALTREAQTRSDAVIGSLPYIAPERFVERSVDPSMDVFSLGCVLYEGLTNQRFYPKDARSAVPTLALDGEAFARHLTERLERLPGAVAPEVAALVSSMLAYDPVQRPSARVVAARLEQLADAAAGVSLRGWARGATVPPPRHGPGTYEGRTLDEASAVRLEDGPRAADAGAPAGAAKTVLRPMMTVAEPEEEESPVRLLASTSADRAAASAAPAFPLRSLDERAFTEQHLDRPDSPASAAREPAPAPVAPRGSRWVRWVVVGAIGVSAVSAVVAAGFVVLAAVLLFVLRAAG
jgi:hypothetical protein